MMNQTKVALTIDYRGDNDDELTIMFAGINLEALQFVFSFLCAGGHGIAKSFSIIHGVSPVWRIGYVNEWLEVTLQNRNEHFASIEDILLLAESTIAREVHSSVDRYELNDFLNLKCRNEKRVVSSFEAEQELNPKEINEKILMEFPMTPTKVLAERYGRTISAIDTMAYRHGVRKSKFC